MNLNCSTMNQVDQTTEVDPTCTSRIIASKFLLKLCFRAIFDRPKNRIARIRLGSSRNRRILCAARGYGFIIVVAIISPSVIGHNLTQPECHV